MTEPEDFVNEVGPHLTTTASEVESKRLVWAWRPWHVVGYLTVLTGDEGIGKSLFTAWTLARYTRGKLPGDWRGKPANVLIVADEDGIADFWIPRLELAQADLKRVHFLWLEQLPDDWNIRDGIGNVEKAMRTTASSVVYVDALLDHLPPAAAGEGTRSAAFVRPALRPLKRLARELEAVGIFTLHPPKGKADSFRGLVQDSQAFTAIPRTGAYIAYHPDDGPGQDSRRVMVRGKANVGRDEGSIEFSITDELYTYADGSTDNRELVVDVAPSELTLADVLAKSAKDAGRQSKAQTAMDIIAEELSDGEWHDAGPIRERLYESYANHNEVVGRARKKLGVETQKAPVFDGGWQWRLPRVTKPLTDPQCDPCDSSESPQNSQESQESLIEAVREPSKNGGSPSNHAAACDSSAKTCQTCGEQHAKPGPFCSAECWRDQGHVPPF